MVLVTNPIQIILGRRNALYITKCFALITLSHSKSLVRRKLIYPSESCPSWRSWIHLQAGFGPFWRIWGYRDNSTSALLSVSLNIPQRDAFVSTRYQAMVVSEQCFKKQMEEKEGPQNIVSQFILRTDKVHAGPCSELEENTQFSP